MSILVISDIHANCNALEAVIQDAGSFDQVWCLGDVVGYGPEPNECIELLRRLDLVCLAGNHDLAVTGKTALSNFSQDAHDAIIWTRHRLSSTNRKWLSALSSAPVTIGQHITLVHASLRDPVWEYMVTREIARDNLNLLTTPICLNGHTHIPIVFRKPWDGLKVLAETQRVNDPLHLTTYDQTFLNPGSVGQPRDEDPRAAYAMLDPESLTFTYRRVQYDVASTQKAMKQAKLPHRLIRRLRFGQ